LNSLVLQLLKKIQMVPMKSIALLQSLRQPVTGIDNLKSASTNSTMDQKIVLIA
jgi:hypothetical protein